MTATEPAPDAWLALRLFALAPQRFKAICLRGAGPARDAMVDRLRRHLPAVRRLPAHADDAALFGGLDVAGSLVAGRPVQREGLLASTEVLLVPMAERLDPALTGRLTQALDEAAVAMVLLDDGASDEEQPPASLTDRAAFLVETALLSGEALEWNLSDPRVPLASVAIDAAAMGVLASVADALGVAGMRPLLFAADAARACAALEGRAICADSDVATAARLVLAPRATQVPPRMDAEDQPSPESADGADETDASGRQSDEHETVLEAALAAIPPDLLARLASGAGSRRARGSGGGKRARSRLRGRPAGAAPGVPRDGMRLALIDTLRAAIPWQPLRAAEPGADAARLLHLRKSDLRVRRFQDRATAVTIVCVDASGSAAMARLAEAKGAVERLLAQAYVTRAEVALIAFRGSEGELVLPPTRSLTRARRALAELPGGGGTPLASAIVLASRLAESVAARGATPLLVFLTDGSANIALDGMPGRARAGEDALTAARVLSASGHGALVIDIAPRPRPEADTLSGAMRARYLPLPLADSASIERAVIAARSGARAA